MDRAIVRALAALTVASLLVPVGAAARKYTREEKRSADAHEVNVLVVKNARGASVVVGREVANISVVATRVVHAGSAKEAEKQFARLRFTVERDGSKLIVKAPYVRHEGARSLWAVLRGNHKSPYIDFAVQVPARLAVQVSTSSGGAQVSSVNGNVTVQSTSGDVAVRRTGADVGINVTSGDIVAEDVRGNLRVESSSGDVAATRVGGLLSVSGTSADVEAKRVGGDAQIQLSSGDLVVAGCLGDLQFQSSSGDAKVDGLKGTLHAMTTSGDIDAIIVPVAGKNFEFNTSSGDVTIRYAAGADRTGFVFDVSTGSGSIEGSGAIALTKVSRHRLTGTVGEGESRVRVATSSGDVSIADNSSTKTHGD